MSYTVRGKRDGEEGGECEESGRIHGVAECRREEDGEGKGELGDRSEV